MEVYGEAPRNRHMGILWSGQVGMLWEVYDITYNYYLNTLANELL